MPLPSPRDEWIAVPVPAIISTEDFKKVQEKLATNCKHFGPEPKHIFLMTHHLRCDKCGDACIGIIANKKKNHYYSCKGVLRRPKVCDMPFFRMNEVNDVIWKWISEMLSKPNSLVEKLKGFQEDAIRSNQALFDRLDIIERRITVTEKQIEKLLFLNLSNALSEEIFHKRKDRFNAILAKLLREQLDITTNLQTQVLSDDQISDITAFCNQIHPGPEVYTLARKRQILEMLDVRCTLAGENDRRVVNIKCQLGQQQLSLI